MKNNFINKKKVDDNATRILNGIDLDVLAMRRRLANREEAKNGLFMLICGLLVAGLIAVGFLLLKINGLI